LFSGKESSQPVKHRTVPDFLPPDDENLFPVLLTKSDAFGTNPDKPTIRQSSANGPAQSNCFHDALVGTVEVVVAASSGCMFTGGNDAGAFRPPRSVYLCVFVKRPRSCLSKSPEDTASHVIIALNSACLFMGMDNGKPAGIAEIGDVFPTFDGGIWGNAFGV